MSVRCLLSLEGGALTTWVVVVDVVVLWEVDFVVDDFVVVFVVVLEVVLDVVCVVVVEVDVDDDVVDSSNLNKEYNVQNLILLKYFQNLHTARCKCDIINCNISQMFVTNSCLPDKFIIVVGVVGDNIHSSSGPLVEIQTILLSCSSLLPQLSQIKNIST